MGKNLSVSVSPWLTALKRVFRSSTKQEELIGEEKKTEKRKKKKTRILWLFWKPVKAEKKEPTVPQPASAPSREDCAAVTIQTAFRGFLARRALRALRGLVKLQALVRGHNVRKQSRVTLRCMQSLVRLQSQILNQRADTRLRRSIEMQRSGRKNPCFRTESESNTNFTSSPASRTKNPGKPLSSRVCSTSSPQYSAEEIWSDCNYKNATPPNHRSLPNYMAVTESARAKAKDRTQRQDVGLAVRKRLSYKTGNEIC